MGTWDIGPFETDMGADFADGLDEAPAMDRESMVRNPLTFTIANQATSMPSKGRKPWQPAH